ncbi:MAG: DUF1552 domain-containing protein [Acidobacteria bacterium]|nr:DUF1552 domain-containing protein [Acidobacteriota bacterium]
MMIFKKAIPRRTFLRGVGTTLALPLLDGMVPALASAKDTAAKPTFRIATVFVPNGRIMSKWTPAAEGAAYEMTPTLEPLAAFRDQFLVLSGLNVKAADAVGNEPGGVHARPAAAFLTGIHPKPGKEVGISMDQVAAREFGKHTQLASLEIGLDSPEMAANDGSYAAYYMNTISWRSGSTPLPMEINPREVFERMFGDSDSADPAERLRRTRKQRSVLDSVVQGVARLLGEVGPSDRAKLTEYLDAIRDIERRIQVAEQTNASAGEQASLQQPSLERPAGIPTTYSAHAKLMFDLQVLAFQTDLTRVITFMMGREQTDRPFVEVGVGDGHHPLSHHKDVPETIAEVEKIDLFQTQLFAYYLEKMRSTPDGDGSLLDHSAIIFGSSLSDGNFHVHNDLPILLVGGGAGKFKGGRHIRYPGLPFSNLLLSVLDMGKIPVEDYLDSKYSDATGKLDILSV